MKYIRHRGRRMKDEKKVQRYKGRRQKEEEVEIITL